jgi:hypothetical protein
MDMLKEDTSFRSPSAAVLPLLMASSYASRASAVLYNKHVGEQNANDTLNTRTLISPLLILPFASISKSATTISAPNPHSNYCSSLLNCVTEWQTKTYLEFQWSG